MALRAKIDKATYDALKADVKTEYKAEGEDFVLDLEELETLPGVVSMKEQLTRAKANEVGEHNKTKKKLTETEARVAELEEGDKSRTNDTKALEDRHKKLLETAKKEAGDEKARLEGQLSSILVDAEAMRIASEISTSPDLILPHIKARLKADLSGDKPVTVVLDAAGVPSVKKLDDLSKEFVADKRFSAIILASKASGSGARQSQGNGGAGTYKGKDFAILNDAERVAFSREDPTGFEAASQAQQNKARGYS